MKLSFYFATVVGLFLALTSAAHATIACSAIAVETSAKSARLYFEPDETSPVMRDVPLNDLVMYPDTDLAPTQAEGWAWVRHDISQADVWQDGLYGWMKLEDMSECG